MGVTQPHTLSRSSAGCMCAARVCIAVAHSRVHCVSRESASNEFTIQLGVPLRLLSKANISSEHARTYRIIINQTHKAHTHTSERASEEKSERINEIKKEKEKRIKRSEQRKKASHTHRVEFIFIEFYPAREHFVLSFSKHIQNTYK